MRNDADKTIRDSLGMPPEAYRGGLYDKDLEPLAVFESQPRVKRTVAKHDFTIRGVRDVLTEHGLDPAAEIAKILQAEVPVLKRDGTPALDEAGKPLMRAAIDPETKLKALLSLQDFVSPRLKAVEVTDARPKLTEEQLDARIAAQLDKAKARKAEG